MLYLGFQLLPWLLILRRVLTWFGGMRRADLFLLPSFRSTSTHIENTLQQLCPALARAYVSEPSSSSSHASGSTAETCVNVLISPGEGYQFPATPAVRGFQRESR